MSTQTHKKDAPGKIEMAIITVSTTRSIDSDESGHWIKKRAVKEGHEVKVHRVIPDERPAIIHTVQEVLEDTGVRAVLITGGTGISQRDVTIEAVQPMFQKELTAYSTVFAQLSYEQIDSAAILSRATAGIIAKSVVFCMPGSIKACKLACGRIIFPELGHIIRHIDKG